MEELGRRYELVLLDSNALIYHLPDPDQRRVLNDPERSLEEKRACFLPQLPDLTAFYKSWIAALDACPKRFFVTDAILDLELSGWRLINNNPVRYRKRYRRSYLPKGDLIRDYDSKSSKKLKNKLIQALHQSGRVNNLVKKRAKGLRQFLEEQLLSRPIWAKSMKIDGLSRLDQDLIVNALAAASVSSVAVLSNDKALVKTLRSLSDYLRNPHWAPRGFEEQGQSLSKLSLQLCQWSWENSQLQVELAP